MIGQVVSGVIAVSVGVVDDRGTSTIARPVHATSTAIIVGRKGGISAPFPNLLSEDETARQFVNTKGKQ